MSEATTVFTLSHVGIDWAIGDPEYWIRGQQPERPGDDLAVYFGPCDACYLALTVDVRINPKPHWVAGLDEMRTWRANLRQSL